MADSVATPEPRFAVVSFGFRAFEVQDTARRRHICAVGIPRFASAANRRPGEAAPAFDPATLAEARAIAAVLNAADARGDLPAALDAGLAPNTTRKDHP